MSGHLQEVLGQKFLQLITEEGTFMDLRHLVEPSVSQHQPVGDNGHGQKSVRHGAMGRARAVFLDPLPFSLAEWTG